MTMPTVDWNDVHRPSTRERDAARTAAQHLARFDHGAAIGLVLEHDSDKAGPITIPAQMFHAIVGMLTEIGNGNAVAVVPVSAELTTQQAAGLLNISRTHLITLLNDKAIPYRMVGTHRKLLARDVLRYRDLAPPARRARRAASSGRDA